MKRLLKTACSILVLSVSLSFAQENPTRNEREHEAKVKALVEELADKNIRKALRAGELLERITKPSDLNELINYLKKGNPDVVQEVLARSIARTRDTRATNGLLFEIDHGSARSKRTAIEALGYVGDDYAVTHIMENLGKSDDMRFHLNGLNALTRIGTERARMALSQYQQSAMLSHRSSFREDLDRDVIPYASRTALEAFGGKYERGKTDFEIKKGLKEKLFYDGAEYLFYQAATRYSDTTKPVVLVCVHDLARNVDRLYTKCSEFAQKYGAALIMPIFDTWNFPKYHEFNCHGRRSDVYLLQLIDFLIEKQDLERKEIYIYGIHHGGDFVQRFAYAYGNRIGRAVAAPVNPVDFDYQEVFPKGLASNPYCSGLSFNESELLQVEVALLRSRAKLEEFEDYVLGISKRGREVQITSHTYMPLAGQAFIDNAHKALGVLFRSSLGHQFINKNNEQDFPL